MTYQDLLAVRQKLQTAIAEIVHQGDLKERTDWLRLAAEAVYRAMRTFHEHND